MSEPRIIVALDFPQRDPVFALVDRLDPARYHLKVGKELFTRFGPSLVEALQQRGFRIFLDLKFHDIPNTVAAACRSAADLGVWMLNVHASGGRRMLEAARAALPRRPEGPYLIAVTLLTSLDAGDLEEIGCPGSPEVRVRQLARLAQESGLDGVVCSPQEVAPVRRALGPAFRLITPGIRPSGTQIGDQKRVMGPADAVAAGAHYLVIGRPITRAPDPLAALDRIQAEIEGEGA